MPEYISIIKLTVTWPGGSRSCLVSGETAPIEATVTVIDQYGNIVSSPTIDTSVAFFVEIGPGSVAQTGSDAAVYSAPSSIPELTATLVAAQASSLFNPVLVTISNNVPISGQSTASLDSGIGVLPGWLQGMTVYIGGSGYSVFSVAPFSLVLDGNPSSGLQVMLAPLGRTLLANVLIPLSPPWVEFNQSTYAVGAPHASIQTEITAVGVSPSLAAYSVNGQGSINSTGLFTAPSGEGPFQAYITVSISGAQPGGTSVGPGWHSLNSSGGVID